MGLQKVAFNFMVERGGKLAKSLLCQKPVSKPINFKSLKYAPALEKDTVQLSQTVGKHKIPRFIYHITSRDNYEKILQSRYLKLSEADNFSGSGIFMLELENFFKHWKNVEVKNQSIIKALLGQTAHDAKDLVILKIPTAKLDSKKLFIRDQKMFFRWHKPELEPEAKAIYEDLVSKAKDTNTNGFIKFTKLFELEKQAKKIWYEKFASFTTKLHMQGKIPATESNLFKQRKTPIEYIYREQIPIQDIELLGEAHCDITPRSSMQEIINVYKQLLKNTQELNHIRHLST